MNGTDITAPTSTSFSLAGGHVYEVAYVLTATVFLTGYIGVMPRVNGINQNRFSITAASTLSYLSPGVSATFIINTTGTTTLDFLFISSLAASSPVGAVSIIELS